MSRRSSFSLPTGRKTPVVSGPFGDSHRTPNTSSHVHTPRKVSKTLGKGGSYYHSQDNVCVSYIRKTSESNLLKPGQGLREPSLPRETGVDLSKLYSHPPEQQSGMKTPDLRRRRAVSEDRSVNVGIGWRGTGGRSVSRQSSKTDLTESGTFKFLPPSSLNQEEPPKLILKKTPVGGSHISIYGDNDLDVDMGNKKLSSGSQPGDIARRVVEIEELLKKLETIQNLIFKVETAAEMLLKRQTESEEFQSQMKKELEGFDLQKGVYRVLESLDGDRRELTRLLKKTSEMQVRHSKGIFLDGENEELKSLTMGVNDLEKKLHKALEELDRLKIKSETLIERQRQLAEERRRKLEEELKKNSALMVLLKDSANIDKMLKDLSYVKSEHMKAEHFHRKIQEKGGNIDEDEMDTDEIVLQRIGVDTQSVTDDVLRTREDIIKLQDAAIDNLNDDLEIDVVAESEKIRQKMKENVQNIEDLKRDIDDFLKNQNTKFADIMKQLRDEEEKRKREEEERLRSLQEEEDRKNQLNSNRESELKLLELEAEQNRNRQIQEYLQSLDGDMTELNNMKEQVLILVGKQKKIKNIRSKRRNLYTINEENEDDLKELEKNTSDLFSNLADQENKVLSIKANLSANNCENIEEDIRKVEDDILSKSKQMQSLSVTTENILIEEQRLLDEAEKQQKEKETSHLLLQEQLLGCRERLQKIKSSAEDLIEKQNETKSLAEFVHEKEIICKLDDLQMKTHYFDKSCAELGAKVINSLKADIKGEDIFKLMDDIDKMDAQCRILTTETDQLSRICKTNFDDVQKRNKENEALMLKNDEQKITSLQQNVKDVVTKQEDLESQLKTVHEDDNEEEKRRKLADLEKLLRQQNDLKEIENNLKDISDQFETLKDFQWTEEEETELNKYGMISSLSIPSFPAGLVKNPELLEAINKRHKELLEMRRKLLLEEQRIREIMEMLEEMEQRQRNAELKRLTAQSREWVHDLVPRGSAMFGAEPTFKSDFHIDPEEARARVASRRASRLQSRESSIAPTDVVPTGSIQPHV